jgi:uncharacterized protein YndB with AHSA1/START domain
MRTMEREPVAKVEQLLHCTAKAAYEAFVDPRRLEQFWLAHATAPLAVGSRVHWKFMVKGAESDLEAVALEPDERIVVRWEDGTTTEWTFEERDGATRVAIAQTGFGGTADEVVAAVVEATQGYAIVLCELKVLLEQGKAMGLVRDKAALIERR